MEKSLLWGNFVDHCKLAKNAQSGCSRFVRIVIALVEFCPLVSQIASIFEKIIVNRIESINEKRIFPYLHPKNIENDKAKNTDTKKIQSAWRKQSEEKSRVSQDSGFEKQNDVTNTKTLKKEFKHKQEEELKRKEEEKKRHEETQRKEQEEIKRKELEETKRKEQEEIKRKELEETKRKQHSYSCLYFNSF